MGDTIRIVVVDDEDSVRRRCVRLLARKNYDVVGARDAAAALDVIRSSPCDLILADIRMPGMDGLELLERVKSSNPETEVIIMTGYAAVETAVQAMKSGAYDYLTKPFDMDELLHVVRRVAEKKQLQREVEKLRVQLRDRDGLDCFLMGESAAMAAVNRFIDKVAAVDCNILLAGESGTGKSLVARIIHARSKRKERPLVVADCAALSGALLESELFGHVAGAFTGARADRKGYFETADGGTIFLDEVSELPPDLQGKLLAAVEDNVIHRLGSSRPVRVDVRVIAATNKNLEDLMARRAFRKDLFYRLNVVSLRIPALRERPEDIPVLVKHFARKHAARLGLKRPPVFPQHIFHSLVAHRWPGNVRELENAVQRALVLAEDECVSLHHLIPPENLGTAGCCDGGDGAEPPFEELKKLFLRDFTQGYVRSCLARHQGNMTRTAEALGMRRTSLQRLLKRLGLNASDFRGQMPPSRRHASEID